MVLILVVVAKEVSSGRRQKKDLGQYQHFKRFKKKRLELQ